MKTASTQQFQLKLVLLSIVAAFAWGEYLGDYLFLEGNDPEPSVLGVSTEPTQISEIPEDPEAYFKCNTTEDCIATPKDCCGCESGGEMVAVNIAMKDEYRGSRLCENKGSSCSKINTCTPREAICDAGYCYLTEPKANDSEFGDINFDTEIDVYDYALLLEEFSLCRKWDCSNRSGDLNQDGIVTLVDTSLLIQVLEKDFPIR